MHYGAVVVGGGFFGCAAAVQLRKFFEEVLLLEQDDRLLQRASYNNQARIHHGYHYPRSLLTGLRSRVNYRRFIEDYRECVVDDFEHYYAVSRVFSNVTAAQFRRFCQRIGAPLEPSPAAVRGLFDPAMVEEVFLATESAFDATKLTERMREALHQSGVEVRLRSQALRLDTDGGERLVVRVAGPSGEQPVSAEMVFNCTYAAMNRLLASSELPIIPVGYEQAELAIVDPPEVLSDKAITVMCGPFFSLMPFPPLRKHTLSHVRYTPHMSWEDSDASVASTPNAEDPERLASNFVSMICDARRYVPCLAECRLSGSLWETKAVLPTSAVDDSRPILFRAHHAIPNLFCVMGGKIDNVYDVLDEIDLLMQQRLAG